MLRGNFVIKPAIWFVVLTAASLLFTTAICIADGGHLRISIQKSPQDPLEGVKVYLFNESGAYLGQRQTTDSTGLAEFDVSEGTYKVRADYLGYQFWSSETSVTTDMDIDLTIAHQDMTVTVAGDYQQAAPISGVPVYLFTPAGAYMSQSQTTDANGQVVFNLPEQAYKARADYLAQQFWSLEFTWQDTAVTVPLADAQVQVTGGGLPLPGGSVYVFTASGTYLSLTDVTDSNGTVTFRLPEGAYKFRADYQGSQYWSGAETLTADQVNPVDINTGGGEFSFTVLKGPGEPLAVANCYVFNETGTYLGMSGITSSEGQVAFNLADGSYKFRVDYLGYQFWSQIYTVPDTLSTSLTVAHQDVTITVEGNYQGTEPIEGVPVYLFTSAGAYLSQSQTTDANGQVVFNLPEQAYKARADYLAQQFWSLEFTWQDTAVTVPLADAQVQVTGGGLPLPGGNVYVFTASGTYLGLTDTTDSNGTVTFRLAAGSHKFRADYQGSQYWSGAETLTADQVNPVDINTGGGEFSFTVLKGPGEPLAVANCYVFNETGTYLGMSGITSSEGQVTFNLADGSYKFRVDYLGYQFWSQIYTVSDTLSASLIVAHQDVTITVEGNYQGTEPIEGVPVYLFTSAGAYLSQNQTTDANGQVVFNLPEQVYKARADYMGQQHWSGEFTWLNTAVTINKGLAKVHVTRSSSDVAGAKVYLFSEQGAFLGWYETTDSTGNVEFLLSDSAFKFRVDEGGDQKWSPLIDITAGVINNVEIDIAPVTVNITADPDSIQSGVFSTLSWISVGAETCVIEPDIGTVDPNGSISVSPTATTVYTISATGPGGTAADSVQVIVIAAPEDVDYGLDYNEQQGGGGLVGETIRILNGNQIEARNDLNFASPNSLGLLFQAFYDSRSTHLGDLGFGWTHTYSTFLDIGVEGLTGDYIRLVDQTGRAHYFLKNAVEVYEGYFNENTHVKVESGEYVWYRLDGSRYGFSDTGKLIWIDDEKGNVLSLIYNAQGLLETVTDSASARMLTFSYTTGLLDHISGPVTAAVADGIWVTYGYDADSNLISVTYADGSGLNYAYTDTNDSHNLTEKRNKSNHLLATWGYDTQDRCTANYNVRGSGATIDYVNATQVDVTDAYGILRTYTIGEVSGRKRVTARQGLSGAPYDGSNLVRWQYDTSMNLTEVQTAGGTIHQYQNYDAHGNPATVILATGSHEARTITYSYHPEMNLALTRSEASVLGTGTKVTIFDYDDDDDDTPNENPARLVSRIIEQGFTNDAAGQTVPYEYSTTFTYSSNGQILSIDGPLTGSADTTVFGYNTATANLLSITRPLIGETRFADYDHAGQAGVVTDVNGHSRRFSYDAQQRIVRLLHDADASTRAVIYNIAGRADSRSDEDGVTHSFEYDAAHGRLIKRIDHEENYITSKYDAQGNLEELSYYDPSHNLTRWRRYLFDHQDHGAPGKLFRVVNPDDTYTQYAYDAQGNVAALTNPNGHPTTFDYDPLDRLSKMTQPDNLVTAYGYDSHGNLASVTDANSNITTYEYDDMGRLITTTSPDAGTLGYVYDEAGNLLSKTDARAITVEYQYDFLNRLTQISYPADNTQPAYTIGYSYDTTTNGTGRLAGIDDPSGSVTLSYDGRGRLVEKTSLIGGESYSLYRSFTPGGRLSSMSYPSGTIIDYERINCTCRVNAVYITDEGGSRPLIENFSYRPFGGADGLEMASGGIVNTEFDLSGRVQAANAGMDKEMSYTYDANGNLTSVSAPATPWRNRTFGYDALNRLRHVQGPFDTIEYTYDEVGNRLSRVAADQSRSYIYAEGSNKLFQITGSDAISYSHDVNGNMVGMGDRVLVYNQNNRLVSVANSADIIAKYVYNGFSQRVSKEVGGTTTFYHYDFDGHLIAESDIDGTFSREYFYNGNSRLAMVEGAGGPIYTFHNDHIGTSQLLTDSTNTVAWEGIYKPFGEVDVHPESSLANNFRYAGQYYDAETELHYNWHRYYDPKTGRYLRADPIGLAGGINLFVYASNNPTNSIDPYGLMSAASAAAIKAIMNNPDPNFTAAQRRAAIRAIPTNLLDPNIHNPYITNDFPSKELVDAIEPDAAGMSVDISTINPFISGGGGTYGVNLEYTASDGLHLYYYSTPIEQGSDGLNIGAALNFNVATGCGEWEGPSDSYTGAYGLFTGGFFHSPLEGEDLGYFGVQGGFTAGPPGVSYTRTIYKKWF